MFAATVKISIFASALLLLSACGGSDEKTVSFDELAPASEKYGEGKTATTQSETKPELHVSELSQMLLDSLGLMSEQINKLDTTLFPDRFGAIKTEKWYAITPIDSFVFMSWKFKDSVKTYNALYNWLDCYGPRCRSVRIGEPIVFSRRGQLLMVNENYLFAFESNRALPVEQIFRVFDGLKWKPNWRFIAMQAPRKKAVWKMRSSDGELLDLLPENP